MMNKINENVVSQALNEFFVELEQKNARLPNTIKPDDFLFPLEDETKNNMVQFFKENAVGFLHTKGNTLLKGETATVNPITEKQLYDVYLVTQKILNDQYPLNKDELLSKVKKEYSEIYDNLYIPNIQKILLQLDKLTDIKTQGTHINVYLNASEQMAQNEENIKKMAIEELKQLENHSVRHEGLSKPLGNYAIRLSTALETLDNAQSLKPLPDINIKLPTDVPRVPYDGVERRSKREPLATTQTADKIYQTTSKDIKEFLEKIEPEEVRLKRLEQEMEAERKPREDFANREDFAKNIGELRKKHIETPKKEVSYRVNL